MVISNYRKTLPPWHHAMWGVEKSEDRVHQILSASQNYKGKWDRQLQVFSPTPLIYSSQTCFSYNLNRKTTSLRDHYDYYFEWPLHKCNSNTDFFVSYMQQLRTPLPNPPSSPPHHQCYNSQINTLYDQSMQYGEALGPPQVEPVCWGQWSRGRWPVLQLLSSRPRQPVLLSLPIPFQSWE